MERKTGFNDNGYERNKLYFVYVSYFFFFFQAEDGIRDLTVTGVQTCALPISTKERVAVVHAGITSASREAIRPVLKRFNTLYFYNTQYEGGVCDRNCFCTGSTPTQNVDKLVPFALKRFGKKVYVVAADYNYGQITSKWVKKFTQDNGGEVLDIDYFPLEVSDFGPAITKIQAAKPDFVMSVLVGGNHISLYRQWAAARLNKSTPGGST